MSSISSDDSIDLGIYPVQPNPQPSLSNSDKKTMQVAQPQIAKAEGQQPPKTNSVCVIGKLKINFTQEQFDSYKALQNDLVELNKKISVQMGKMKQKEKINAEDYENIHSDFISFRNLSHEFMKLNNVKLNNRLENDIQTLEGNLEILKPHEDSCWSAFLNCFGCATTYELESDDESEESL